MILELWKPATILTCSKVDVENSHLPALGVQSEHAFFCILSCFSKKKKQTSTPQMRKSCELFHIPRPPPALGLSASSLALQSFWESSCEKKIVAELASRKRFEKNPLISVDSLHLRFPNPSKTIYHRSGSEWWKNAKPPAISLWHPASPAISSTRFSSSTQSSEIFFFWFWHGFRCVCTVLKMDENGLQPPFMTTWMRKMIIDQTKSSWPMGHTTGSHLDIATDLVCLLVDPEATLDAWDAKKFAWDFWKYMKLQPLKTRRWVYYIYVCQFTWL